MKFCDKDMQNDFDSIPQETKRTASELFKLRLRQRVKKAHRLMQLMKLIKDPL